MIKNLLTLTVLGACLSANAQSTLSFLDTSAKVYVGKNALVYNGGGMTIKNNAQVLNYGNVMIVGGVSDVFKTLDASNNPKIEANAGGNFINKINETTAYNLVNSANSSTAPVYTYGQLYISGLSQDNVDGFVDQELRAVKHGSYQQIAMPFFKKTFSTLNPVAELGKTFVNTRWSQNEILKWNNKYARFDFVDVASKTLAANSSTNENATGYYILGSKNLDLSTKVYTIKGIPFAEENIPNAKLEDAGTNADGSYIDYGASGLNKNIYNERYNSYLQDGFHIASGGSAWGVSDANGKGFGKNLYQFGNPFLTNLDLSRIAYNEGASGDGNFLSNIYGIRLEVSGVQYTTNVGGGSTSYKYVTFTNTSGIPGGLTGGTPSVPVGDVDYMMVRPMGTFVIKMKDNTKSSPSAERLLDFKTLRRFQYYPRVSNSYNVTASRTSSKVSGNSTTKQLGVIALDANGNEIGKTYYVVYADAVTGHPDKETSQVTAFSDNIVGTYEEAVAGGYDYNQTNKYWLYINEANESNFKGKNIKLVNYSTNIKSYKFEIREDAKLVNEGTHALSSGEGFYLRKSVANSELVSLKQGDTFAVDGTEYDLYYGKPDASGTLGTTDGATPSRTKIVYIQEADKYIVKFDPNWKKADVYIHDMSGKLIFSEKNVSASSDYLIKLDNGVNNTYIINVVSDLGVKVTSKIIK